MTDETTSAGATSVPARTPLVVVGSSSTAVRAAEEIARAGEQVVMLATGVDPYLADELASKGVDVRATPLVREAELRDAGVEQAKGVVIAGLDDVAALRTALAAEDVAPEVPLVLEMANPELGGKMHALLPNCTVLSSAHLAAPSFVAACLEDGEVRSFEIADRAVVAGSRARVGGELLLTLGDSHRADSGGVFAEDGDIVLGTQVVGKERRLARQSGWVGALTHVFDRRLRWVIGVLVGLMLISTMYFHFVAGLDWLNSLYVALTASTLTGIGDINDLPLHARFGGVVIQLLGVILSSGITAVIVDALISARIASLTGGLRGKPHDHVVVCGLGRIGREVVLRLHGRGVPVVAIERNEDSAGVLAVRQAKVPVIIAEASDRQALEQAGIARAEAVLAVTDNDAVNLEIGVVAAATRPGIRIVTRLFDHELAERVERRLELGPTRSVSMLAAPAFAAAALGRRREQIVSVGRRVLIFTELTVQEGSRAQDGITTHGISSHPGVRVLATRIGDRPWEWDPSSQTLRAGDKVAVVATRLGLGELLATIKRPGSPARGRGIRG